MPEYKEKPKFGRPKARPPGALSPRRAARQMKEKYIRELKQAPEDREPGDSYAAEQVEQAGHWAVDKVERAAVQPLRRSLKQKNTPREKPAAGQEDAPETPEASGQPVDHPTQANAPKERRTVERRTGADSPGAGKTAPAPKAEPGPRARPVPNKQVSPVGPRSSQPGDTHQAPGPSNRAGSPPGDFSLNNRRRGSAAFRQPGDSGGRGAARSAPSHGERSTPWGGTSSKRSSAPKERPAPTFKTHASPQPKVRPGAPHTPRPPIMAGTARQTAQQRVKQLTAPKIQRAGKGLAVLTRKLAAAVTRAAAALVSSLAALAGGAVLLVALAIIIVIAAVANSPFGLFFAQERNAPGTLSVSEAVNEVNIRYNAQLAALQAGDYDDIVIQGQAADWPEVLAVFSARHAGAEDGVDVATLDADRVDKLTAVFWDMTEITSWVETIDHPGNEDSGDWTEYILHITITARTADDMRAVYAFTNYQNSALDELLTDRAALSALAGSLSITSADALDVLAALPDGLSPERKAVVETALKLYGKVGYFWGGKSLVLGWDSRWGQLAKVTAAGSSTTGTYRPYGLDCSGMVDWVFYNVTGGGYVIGHGGGAHAQHTYCTDISWDEAQPGDLVFYPEDEHVGIVCGRDGNGNLLVIHCASGANNVVITGISGFTSVARPVFYGE